MAPLLHPAVIYVSGPFSAETREGEAANIRAASAWSTHLCELGFAPICPHTNIRDIGRLDYEGIMAVDLALVRRSNALFMLPGWEKSPGAVRERDLALSLGVPVFESVDALVRSDLPRQNLTLAQSA